MKHTHKRCVDCGCEAVSTAVDEVKPVFRMETVEFACGAVLKNSYSANGNIGKISHSGCKCGER